LEPTAFGSIGLLSLEQIVYCPITKIVMHFECPFE